jgi:hypothetical protein
MSAYLGGPIHVPASKVGDTPLIGPLKNGEVRPQKQWPGRAWSRLDQHHVCWNITSRALHVPIKATDISHVLCENVQRQKLRFLPTQ